MLADPVLLDAGWTFALERAGNVLREMPDSAHEIAAVLLDGLFDELRVGRQVVVGCEELEPLAQREPNAAFRLGVHARHAPHCVTCHPGHRQERLGQQVERKLAPFRAAEARGVRRALDLRSAAAERAAGELGHGDRLREHLPRELRLAAGRGGETSENREPGAGERLRGQAASEIGHECERSPRYVVGLLHRSPARDFWQCKKLR